MISAWTDAELAVEVEAMAWAEMDAMGWAVEVDVWASPGKREKVAPSLVAAA